MKKILIFIIAATATALLCISMLSFKGEGDKSPTEQAYRDGYEAGTTGTIHTYTWDTDTITNAANDTLTLPWTLLSNYAIFSFKGEGDKSPTEQAYRDGYEAGTTGTIHTYTWDTDTITNAANDTLTLPWTLLSNYAISYHVVRANISGTTSLKVYVQASGLRSGTTDWATIDSTSSTGATNAVIMLPHLYGQRQRLIVDGAGTQSSSHSISAVLKKTN
jgi:ribosome modulation factor